MRLILILISLAVAVSHGLAVQAQDMALSGVLIDGEGWELVADGFKFTEGPAADAEGNVYFTDIPNNRVHKVDVAGKVSVFVENNALSYRTSVSVDRISTRSTSPRPTSSTAAKRRPWACDIVSRDH